MSVTIGIDPHKSTHTAVAVDCDEHQIARLTLAADRHQTDRLLAWAEPLDADRVWAIESAAGLGRLLAQQLIAAGEHVVNVPPTLAARVRLLGSSKASKNDPNDALATAIAGLRHCGLRTVARDGHTAILRLLADRHHDLTGLRTQAACRLHVILRELAAGGAPLRISAAHGTEFLELIDIGDDLVAAERKRLAREHLADMHRLDADIDAIKVRIRDAVVASGTTALLRCSIRWRVEIGSDVDLLRALAPVHRRQRRSEDSRLACQRRVRSSHGEGSGRPRDLR